MDFSSLPYTPFLQILGYLPFNEPVRSGRVNRSFRYISQLAIEDTKSLDLTDHQFDNLCLHGLVDLLNLCSPNLERIRFPDMDDGALYAMVFSKFQCPRLTEVDLIYCPADNDILESVVRNNPKIKILTWSVCSTNDGNGKAPDPIRFPDIVSKNLVKLSMNKCNDDTLRSLTGRCPNLKSLEISVENITADVFDQFFASIPQLRKIELTLENNRLVLEDLKHFWRLPLTSLSIEFWGDDNEQLPTDNLLYKISLSLPRLKNLSIPMNDASSDGIASLANLHKLEDLELALPDDGWNDVYEGIQELTRCGKLRRLSVTNAGVDIDTLIDLIRYCPNLNFVKFQNIDYVWGEKAAAEALGKLSGLGNRQVAIKLYGCSDEEDDDSKEMWDSDEVKEAIRKLKETDGMVIMFGWPRFMFRGAH